MPGGLARLLRRGGRRCSRCSGRSRCINAPSARLSPVAFPVGLGLLCPFPVSQNPRTSPTGGMPGAGTPDPPGVLTIPSSGCAQMVLVVALVVSPT